MVKDGGDDPDITTGSVVYALVRRSPSCGIRIDGGEGIGRVTLPGLDQPVGSAAINSVPRRMIRENLEEVLAVCAASCVYGALSGQAEAVLRKAVTLCLECCGIG